MSLVNCLECQNLISDKALACPCCGMPQKNALLVNITNKNIADHCTDLDNETKLCAFCQESIHAKAIKCKHCGSMLKHSSSYQQTLEQPIHEYRKLTGENNIIRWYLKAFERYGVFAGRARRKEYWYFSLVNIFVSISLKVIGNLIGLEASLYYFYNLVALVPHTAVAVRRMHDTNRSGWWILAPVANIIMLAQDSQHGANKYGSNPKSTVSSTFQVG